MTEICPLNSMVAGHSPLYAGGFAAKTASVTRKPPGGASSEIDQILAVVSLLAVAMRLPAGLLAAAKMKSVWPPCKVNRSPTLIAFQTRAVRSWLAVMRRLPSALKKAFMTLAASPLNLNSGVPASVQTWAVPSLLAVTIDLLSGLKATL